MAGKKQHVPSFAELHEMYAISLAKMPKARPSLRNPFRRELYEPQKFKLYKSYEPQKVNRAELVNKAAEIYEGSGLLEPVQHPVKTIIDEVLVKVISEQGN